MPAGLLVPIAILIMMIFYRIAGEYLSSDSQLPCSDREYSPLCFCQSTYRRSSATDIFLSTLSLSHCTPTSYSTRQCFQGRFSPSSTHVTQLVPNLLNHSHCFEDTRCLHTLQSTQRCRQCQSLPSSLSSENNSYTVSTGPSTLPTDSCFYICEHDQSCGFLCFDRRFTKTIQCSLCRGRRRNVTCRCMKVKQPRLCSPSTLETTTPRWMQKRGFPAAAILALFVLVSILLIIVVKLINRRLKMISRRQDGSIRRSIATMTTYRSRQPSPSTVVSLPNTPLIPPAQLSRDVIPANTMVELLHDKSREYVVGIHRRDDEDELSVFLLEKTPELKPKSKDIITEDDDDEENMI